MKKATLYFFTLHVLLACATYHRFTMYDNAVKSSPIPTGMKKSEFPFQEQVDQFLMMLGDVSTSERQIIMRYIRERLVRDSEERIKSMQQDIEISQSRIQELQQFAESIHI